MIVPGSVNPLLLTSAAAATGFQVSRSLRFNSADSAYLNRTPSVAGNRKTWTWSGWVKRSGLGTFQNLFGTADAGFANGTYFLLIDDNTLSIEEYGASSFTWRVRSTQVFRDTSAWGHLLVACDTTQATASNRVRIYWNGTEITSFSTANYPTQNLDTSLNTASLHGIGRAGSYNSYYFNGYLANVQFIDGQQLTPSSFTEVSATTGQLIPKAYTGTYGLVSVAAATGALPIFNTTDTYGAAVGSGVRTDAFASSIALDLPMGTGAGLSLTDQSPAGRSSSVKTVTNNGASSSTSYSKFYGGSAYFNKTEVDYLTVGSASDWVAFNNGNDFTFETWFYPTSTGGGGGAQHCLFETNGGGTTTAVGLVIGVDPNGAVRYFLGKGSAPALNLTTDNGLVPVGAWTHIAVVQQSKIIKVYINGTVRYTYDASSYSFPSSNPAYPLYIGKLVDGYWVTDGYLQDYRLYTSAKYTSSFSPVTSYNNSFYLTFADNSSNTATTLGKDTSGNGNNWTPNNFVAGGTDYAATGSDPNSRIAAGTYQNFWTGNLSSSITISQGGYVVMTNTTLPSATSTIGFYTQNGASTATLRINGTSVFTATSSTLQWYDFSYSGAINKVEIGYLGGSGSSNNFYAFRVDGTTIVGVRGSDIDGLVDTPTSYGTDDYLGGSVRGNYCTWNPLNAQLGAGSVSNGNLDFTGPSGSANYNFIGGTFAIDTSSTSGWYFEFTQTTYGNGVMVSLLDTGFQASALSNQSAIGYSGTNSTAGISYANEGSIHNYGSTTSGLTSWTSSGDIISIAIKNNKIWFAKNGTWISGSPSAETSPSITLASTKYVTPAAGGINSSVISLNFGQRPFAYTAPSGFKALCDTNLPAPVVAKPNTLMDVVKYNGNSSTQSITSLAFNPDMVWSKCRNVGRSHRLSDAIRGSNVDLYTDTTASDNFYGSGSITAFTANGFNLDNSASSQYNTSGETYVSWCWYAGGSTVSNTQGSITSQVRANPSAGFSVITATTTNTSTQTFGHGLNVAPVFHIIKLRNGVDDWYVYHSSVGATKYLKLNSTAAQTTSLYMYNDTAPTSSLITLGSGWNSTSYNIVCYAFAPVVGYSSFGNYTGNGSTDGPFVFTGMRPRFLMIKRTDTGGSANYDWMIYDTARDTYNLSTKKLTPNSSVLEGQDSDGIATDKYLDILSNGFKIKVANAGINGSSGTFIYAAFAEAPFQYARAR